MTISKDRIKFKETEFTRKHNKSFKNNMAENLMNDQSVSLFKATLAIIKSVKGCVHEDYHHHLLEIVPKFDRTQTLTIGTIYVDATKMKEIKKHSHVSIHKFYKGRAKGSKSLAEKRMGKGQLAPFFKAAKEG